MLSSPNTEVVELVPACIAIENRVIPLADWNGLLILGSDSVLSDANRARLSFILGRRVRGVVRSIDWVDVQLQTLYQASSELKVPEWGSVTNYWPGVHRFTDDGTLIIRCTGWQKADPWTGAAEFSPTHEDFDFWCWVVGVRQFDGLLPRSELPAIRRIWRRYLARRDRRRG